MTAPTYQYVDLPDASLVTTRALVTEMISGYENLARALEYTDSAQSSRTSDAVAGGPRWT